MSDNVNESIIERRCPRLPLESGGHAMKPGPRDRRYPILITGRQLAELKRFTWSMAEAFGLDRRIESYQGKRPIGLYRWDLDCLEAVVAMALDDAEAYPAKSGPEYAAMKQLAGRIQRLRQKAYGEFEKD